MSDLVRVANLVAALAAAIGLLVLAWQTREAARSRRLAATLAVFDDLGSEESRERWRYVYNKLATLPSGWGDDDVQQAERVPGAFQRAAYLCRKGFIDEGLVLDFYGPAFARSWSILGPWAVALREARGPEFVRDFERLGIEAQLRLQAREPCR